MWVGGESDSGSEHCRKCKDPVVGRTFCDQGVGVEEWNDAGGVKKVSAM